MLFNSLEYLFFLPLVFTVYWLLNKSLKFQNLFILIASYIFYGCWDEKFLLLIAFTTLCTFISGILIERSKIHKVKKIVLIVNIILNLGILGLFKYYDFFVDSFIDLLNLFGYHVKDSWSLKLILPVGISFYTFQALGYAIDVYKHKIKATDNIVAFFAYISFFPQLLAGPIGRSTELLPQMLNKRKFSYEQSVDGLRQILWGLFKKVVVADNCANIVNPIFSNYENYDGATLIFAAIIYSFQIYGDFSGYSDMAIGSAKLFGIRLMKNFSYPYLSRNVAEFWKRWHISLLTWFRDYIYIPLGGSRCSLSKVIRNTFIVFLVSGIWHGANWTFVLWGTYHAVLFIPLILMKKKRYKGIVAENKSLPTLNEFVNILITFIFCTIGWVIFRSDSIIDVFGFFETIVTNFSICVPSCRKSVLIFIVIMLLVEWINRRKEYGLEFNNNVYLFRNMYTRNIFYIIIILICLSFSGSQSDFIYFQF